MRVLGSRRYLPAPDVGWVTERITVAGSLLLTSAPLSRYGDILPHRCLLRCGVIANTRFPPRGLPSSFRGAEELFL